MDPLGPVLNFDKGILPMTLLQSFNLSEWHHRVSKITCSRDVVPLIDQYVHSINPAMMPIKWKQHCVDEVWRQRLAVSDNPNGALLDVVLILNPQAHTQDWNSRGRFSWLNSVTPSLSTGAACVRLSFLARLLRALEMNLLPDAFVQTFSHPTTGLRVSWYRNGQASRTTPSSGVVGLKPLACGTVCLGWRDASVLLHSMCLQIFVASAQPVPCATCSVPSRPC